MAKKFKLSDAERQKLWEKIKNAETYHREHFARKAEENMALMRGDTSYLPRDFDYDVINPNLIFSTVRTYVPALYPAHPKVFAKPRGPEWGPKKKDNVFSAFIAQSVLEYYQYELKMKETDKLAILGGLVHGISYVMDAWVTEVEVNEINPQVVKDQPMHRFVSGIDLIPDPAGLEFEDKSFVVRVFGKQYDQMRKSKYSNIPEKNDNDYTGVDPRTKQIKLPKFYEIWDKTTERVYVLSEENNENNLHFTKEFDIRDGFPFTPLIFNPMIDNFYPMSLVEVLSVMQKFITLMVSYGARHAKLSVPKIMGFTDYLDTNALNALKSGEILDFIALKKKTAEDKTTPNDVISSLRMPGLPPDFYNMIGMVRDFMNIVSGVSEDARGGGQSGETATKAAIVDTYLRSRMGDYKDIADDFFISSRRKQLQVIKNNASSDKYLRFNKIDLMSEYFYPPEIDRNRPDEIPKMTQPQEEFQKKAKPAGKFVFVPWNKKDISGEYDLELGVGAGLPTNEEFAYKKAMNNLNILANVPMVDKVKVALQFLRDIKVPLPETWISPPPPPPPPEPPKKSVNISINSKDLVETSPETLEKLLQFVINNDGNTPGEPVPGKISPISAGLQRESMTNPGLQAPPNLSDIPGGK